MASRLNEPRTYEMALNITQNVVGIAFYFILHELNVSENLSFCHLPNNSQRDCLLVSLSMLAVVISIAIAMVTFFFFF